MKGWGNGSRCEIAVVGKSGGGHVFMAEQVEGKTVFLDPQAKLVYDEDIFENVKRGLTKFFRTDTLSSIRVFWSVVRTGRRNERRGSTGDFGC